MMSKTAAAALIKALGDFLENPGLSLEKQNSCSALIGNIRFSFFWSEKYNCLFIQALAGSATALKDPDAAFAAILKGNHLWAATSGGVFGLNDGNIYYSYRLDFPFAEESGYTDLLCDLLPYMVGAIERVQDILEIESGFTPVTTETPGMMLNPSALA
jgi:hypothetical protein